MPSSPLDRDAGHDRDLPALFRAVLTSQFTDILNEPGHDAGGVFFVRLEVGCAEHEIKFDPVRRPVAEKLFDQGQLILAHRVDGVVVGPSSASFFSYANLSFLVPFESSTPLPARFRLVLQLEAGKDGDPQFPPSLDHLAQLIGAEFGRLLHHTHDAPVDVTLPHLFLLSDDPADFGLMEEDISVTEAEDEGIHAGAGHFVDRPLQHVNARRRLNPLGVVMMGVVVIDQTRTLHRRPLSCCS